MLRRLLSFGLILSLLFAGLPFDSSATAEEDAFAAGSAADSTYKTLRRGDRDGDDSADIVILQNRLIELGYLRDAADGVYGGNTQDAISALQRSNNLEDTGVATPELQQLLFSGAELVTYSNSTDPESMIYRVQDKLACWGFLADNPDGVAGSKTNEAVICFKEYLQDYLKLHPTPSPEPSPTPASTQSSGFADAPIVEDVPLRPNLGADITDEVLDFVDGVYDFEIYRETVTNGDSGDEVLRVQRRLHQLKYLALVDGSFGATTERALLYFQKKNGLSQSAVADEATQRLLFSESAVKAEEYVNLYKLVVDISDQRVYVYQWTGSDYTTCVGEMICSTGTKGNETPLGTYQAAGATGTGEWYWFKDFNCYAKWGYRIIGGILFHSVIYSKGKVLNKTSVKKLGRPASHGCIRLKVEHAKWIYENCAAGTTVVIQE